MKSSETEVGEDLEVLRSVNRSSMLNMSLSRRLVSPIYCLFHLVL